ncbi:hypothetical protein BX600DRAFT_551795 [Xylariales sp. PMI_506]|nr:hypothetical protein BX600DRAFT_551795 [Xylariales sp. PMI_506]
MACFYLSNGHQFLEDPRPMLNWVGDVADKRFLRAFFSWTQSTIAALWEILMEMSHNMKHARAFEALVDISIDIDGGQWVKTGGGRYLFTAVYIGTPRAAPAARRILQLGVSPNVSSPPKMMFFDFNRVKRWPSPLHLAAKKSDLEMIKILIEFGANLDYAEPEYQDISAGAENLGCPLQILVNSHRFPRTQCIEMLLHAGAQVDIICEDPLNRDCLTQLGWKEGYPQLLTDKLWIYACLADSQNDYYIYGLVAPFSHFIQKNVTVSGILRRARDSIGAIKEYINSQLGPSQRQKVALLELSLVTAVQTLDRLSANHLLEFGVHPDTPALAAKTPDHRNPMAEAAEAWDADLLEMLCRYGGDINRYDLLKHALWWDPWYINRHCILQILLGDLDRRLATIKFIFMKGFDLRRYPGEHAIISAVVPSESFAVDAVDEVAQERDIEIAAQFSPDVELFNYLVSNGIRHDLESNGQNLLHLALSRSCNLKTALFLFNLGCEIHPRLDVYGMSMLQYARFNYSKDRSSLIRLLYKHGGSTKAGEDHYLGIVEASLCSFIYEEEDTDEIWCQKLPPTYVNSVKRLFNQIHSQGIKMPVTLSSTNASMLEQS